MKVAMKPLLLTLFDSKGEQPPQLVVWGGVLVVSCLGCEEFLKKRQSLVFDEDLLPSSYLLIGRKKAEGRRRICVRYKG